MNIRNVFWMKILSNAVLALSVVLCSSVVNAENRWVTGTQSQKLGMVVSDRIRPRIYLADSANGELVVIDSATERVSARIAVDVSITDMAISKDNRWLDVVANGTVYRIDLNGMNVNLTYNIPVGDDGKPVRSIAFNYKGEIYAVSLYGNSQYDRRSPVYLLDSAGSNILSTFNTGTWLNFYSGLLKTDSTGTVLYVGEQGLSPLSIHKFDVTDTQTPTYLGKNQHGALGSNLLDYAISARYDEIYVASGSPYGIQVVDSETLALVNINSTGPYPAGTAISPSGSIVYGLPSSPYNNYLYEFDVESGNLINQYPLSSNVNNGKAIERGLALDVYGEKAFVVHGNTHPSYASMELQVVDLDPQSCGN